MPFSSLISQSKCSTWSQVMFSGVGLLIKCLSLLQLQIESSLPNLIFKNYIKWVSWMGYSMWQQEITLQTMFPSILLALGFFQLVWLEAVLGFFWEALKSVKGCCVFVCTDIPIVVCTTGIGIFGGWTPKNSIFHEERWDKWGLCCEMTPRVNNMLYSFQVLYCPDCHLNPGWRYSPST